MEEDEGQGIMVEKLGKMTQHVEALENLPTGNPQLSCLICTVVAVLYLKMQ